MTKSDTIAAKDWPVFAANKVRLPLNEFIIDPPVGGILNAKLQPEILADNLPWFFDEDSAAPAAGPKGKPVSQWTFNGDDGFLLFADPAHLPRGTTVMFITWPVGVDKNGKNPVFLGAGVAWTYTNDKNGTESVGNIAASANPTAAQYSDLVKKTDLGTFVR